MDAKTCLEKLKSIEVLDFATIDDNRNPQIRNISAIHYDDNALYFFTARGKNFCKELLNNGKVQILGYTKQKEMIRLSAKAYPVPDSEQKKWIDIIFEDYPYLYNVYPDNTNEIGIVFCIDNCDIEYFNLGVKPIFRESYIIGNREIKPRGYFITDNCISCGACTQKCPQNCIEEGTPYVIKGSHCLHCGACYEICPVKAVINL